MISPTMVFQDRGKVWYCQLTTDEDGSSANLYDQNGDHIGDFYGDLLEVAFVKMMKFVKGS